MILQQPLQGKRLRLRTAEPHDASFALHLRTDPELNRFLKPIDPSLENQKQWIQDKQSTPNDYHMIMESLDSKPLGVIALYDIKVDQSFDWGRWVIAKKAPFYAAHESMILLYNFAFNILGLKKAFFEVRKENERVIDFHKNYGAVIEVTDANYHWFGYKCDQFNNDLGMQSVVKDFRESTLSV